MAFSSNSWMSGEDSFHPVSLSSPPSSPSSSSAGIQGPAYGPDLTSMYPNYPTYHDDEGYHLPGLHAIPQDQCPDNLPENTF